MAVFLVKSGLLGFKMMGVYAYLKLYIYVVESTYISIYTLGSLSLSSSLDYISL